MENNTARRGAGRNGDMFGRDTEAEGEGFKFSFLDRLLLAGGVNGAFIASTGVSQRVRLSRPASQDSNESRVFVV